MSGLGHQGYPRKPKISENSSDDHGAQSANRFKRHLPHFTLMAVTLAACGGGGGDADSEISVAKVGSVVKGPVEGARVFLDYNQNGTWDSSFEPSSTSDADGKFSILGVADQENAYLVAVLDGAVDTSSGTTFISGSLKAPSSAEVISPFTSLIVETQLSAQEVKIALGLGDFTEFNPLTFNPYDAGADSETAVAVEKVAHNIMMVVEAASTIIQQSGMDVETAFGMAISLAAAEVKSKAISKEVINFSSGSQTISNMINNAITEASAHGANVSGMETLKAEIINAIENAADGIDGVLTVNLEGVPTSEFQLVNIVLEQIDIALSSNDPSRLTISDPNVAGNLINALVENSAPVVVLTNKQLTVSESTDNLKIAKIFVRDPDGDQVTISLAGADSEFFEISPSMEIVFKEQPNFEIKQEYQITIVASDGLEQSAQKLTIEIENKDPDATLTINVPKLDSLPFTILRDLTAVEYKVEAFYQDTNTGLNTVFDSFDITSDIDISNIKVTSQGISIIKSTGEYASLNFNNFSPSNLSSLLDVLLKVDTTEDLDQLNISGGFQSLKLGNYSGILAELVHTSQGIEWRNPNAKNGQVDTFIIEGEFGNQISDYIDIVAGIQNSLEQGLPENGLIADAANSFASLIGFTGVSAKADGETIIRIGADPDPTSEALQIFIDGGREDHVFELSLNGGEEFLTDLVNATGGLNNFVELLAAGGGVEVRELGGGYYAYHGLTSSEEFRLLPSGADQAYFNYISGEKEGSFLYPEIENAFYTTENGDRITEEQYNDLMAIIDGAQNYLAGIDQPFNNLDFGFSYSHGNVSVIDAHLGSLVSLNNIADFYNNLPTEVELVVEEHEANGVTVTSVSDPREAVTLNLIGVNKTDFEVAYDLYEGDLELAVLSFLPTLDAVEELLAVS